MVEHDGWRHLLSSAGLFASVFMITATSPGGSAHLYECGANALMAENFILVPETPSLFFSIDVSLRSEEDRSSETTDGILSENRSRNTTLFLSGRYMTGNAAVEAPNDGVELALSKWQRVADDLCSDDTVDDLPADTGDVSSGPGDVSDDTGTVADTGAAPDTEASTDTAITEDTEPVSDTGETAVLEASSDTGIDAMPVPADGFEFWWVDGGCYGWHELKSMPLELLTEDDSEAFAFELTTGSESETVVGEDFFVDPEDIYRVHLDGNGHAAVDFQVSSVIYESHEYSTGAGFGCIGTTKAPKRLEMRDAELCSVLNFDRWSWTEVDDPALSVGG